MYIQSAGRRALRRIVEINSSGKQIRIQIGNAGASLWPKEVQYPCKTCTKIKNINNYKILIGLSLGLRPVIVKKNSQTIG
jgi:hypothetical protein